MHYHIAILISVSAYLACVWKFWRSGLANVFHPVTYYLFFHGLVFVIRPILGELFSYNAIYVLYVFTPSEQTRVTVLLAATLGLICFQISCLMAGGNFVGVAPTPIRLNQLQKGLERTSFVFGFVCLICLPIAVYGQYFDLNNKISGINLQRWDSATGISANVGQAGYLTDAANMLLPIVIMIAWIGRFRLLALLPFIAYAVTRLMVGWGRWTFIMAFAALALAWLYSKGARWPKPRLLF